MFKSFNRSSVIWLLLVFVAGSMLIGWVVHSTDRQMRAELLVHAKIIAKAIDIEHVAALSGSENDLNTPAYHRIKSQLASVRTARHQCRFLYLMGQRPDGTVFFFVDSLTADSKDYAGPGLVYGEIPDPYLRIFDTRQEAVVGPVTDRWGTLVSALVPLIDPHTGIFVAVLGMDIDADDWNKEIFGHCLIPFGVMLLFMGLIVLQALREQAIKSHRESEERYRLAFHTSPDSINLNRLEDGTYIDINQGFTTIMGYTREEVIEKSSLSLDIWKNPGDRKRLVHGLMKTGHVKNLEARFVGKDGNIRWGLMSARLTKMGADNVIISITRDITDRKKMEEALRESEEKFRSMMEAMKDPVYICSPDFRVEYMNPTMINRIGHDATGAFCFKALHDLNKVCPWCLYHKVQENEHVESDIVSPRDNHFYHISWSPIVHEDGSISSMNILRDTTDLIKLENQLRQSHKMEAIGTLAGGIAHDFNNILYPIVGYSELLKDDLPAASPLQGHVDRIFQSALRAKGLVKQILAFSHRGHEHLSPVKLQPVIKAALKLLRSSIPTTIDIQSEIRPDCGIVVADPTQIHQVIINLATNACHAMEASGGSLQVMLEQIRLEPDPMSRMEMLPGEYAVMTVSDTGMGIEKEDMDKIFDPYFTTKETGKGTGLGLSVVMGIIKSCKGDIRIFSKPGQGTQVQVYLPIVERQIDDGPVDLGQPICGGTEKILIVDDEAMIVKMEQQMLERLGYQVVTCTGSGDALALFRADPAAFDLIVTDMTMPGMTGVQLSGEIKKIRPDIPIILCSGFDYVVDGKKCKALGIQGVIHKPLIMKEFVGAIRKVLGTSGHLPQRGGQGETDFR